MTKYFDGSIAQLEEKVEARLSDYRFQHVRRVRDYAIQLAEANGVDPDQAEVAALVHDYAKERSDSDFIAVIKRKKMDPDLMNWGNYIWHGVVGAEMIHDELGITDSDILTAVREHTTGAGATMSKLSQVIFMADYLEVGRDFDGVQVARDITKQSLGQGVKYQIVHTLARLVKKETPIYPKSLETYNYWVRKEN
ncbi:bis(5'-nucleosyl)-tetraphosphatase (symmetrical) YqeK [Leuconostoc falkenbergense]|jgi:predicted HD superfamily hydrolase involved in NAD metabolism|uniref:bis(5'-nucleosyl)-tetraphosphatase (symmetrical) n=2 Tax=Leuconostoc falkenbergense TaxID=2766470 RepID=A0A9X3E9I2_9LACO|nr:MULTISPECIES: bis(5'-nucleosyl)-tetraphosphatase (symmetrical) YqeK [Leuconostoc]RDG19263.1 HD domain-containing protein [Leuconostoc pseudomesenteroides]MCT4378400.1 HD domain-containing protein [Leuconostoc falkenbergense]MCT4390620.1 HD domain-containing protein [Leuconostoc falkenbergense]MCX7579664.1 HD domain-containing protein [Leuconostoc falkenbergense]MDM7645692.1 bis(5'-nucleosyl)-tetraphosphatase (symmetrical) YqeK [Leuconostoc falkenbergense]